MKTIKLLQAVLLITVVAMTASCSSSRGYYSQSYPRPQANFSLIISPSPGFVVQRNPEGMYYYRDQWGHIYWRGYDNRYYLDRKYVNRTYYHHQQYNDWNRYHYNGHHRR